MFNIHLRGQNADVGKTPLTPEALGRLRPLPLPASACSGILCLGPSVQSVRSLRIAFSSVSAISAPPLWGHLWLDLDPTQAIQDNAPISKSSSLPRFFFLVRKKLRFQG